MTDKPKLYRYKHNVIAVKWDGTEDHWSEILNYFNQDPLWFPEENEPYMISDDDEVVDTLSVEDFERDYEPVEESDDGWQDISTAPRDGNYFIAYEDGLIFMAGWDGVRIREAECGSKIRPTHWRPLPAPPKLPKTEE